MEPRGVSPSGRHGRILLQAEETSDQAEINYHPEHIHGDGGNSNTIPGPKQYLLHELTPPPLINTIFWLFT